MNLDEHIFLAMIVFIVGVIILTIAAILNGVNV